jgi:K+ transporter
VVVAVIATETVKKQRSSLSVITPPPIVVFGFWELIFYTPKCCRCGVGRFWRIGIGIVSLVVVVVVVWVPGQLCLAAAAAAAAPTRRPRLAGLG